MWLTASAAAGPAESDLPDLGAGGERYELGELLDRGASGAVWQALDRKLGRNVAIKVFHDDRSPAVEQSLAEARAASEINSDHVVRVLDVHAHAPPYLVMELVGEHDPRTGAFAPGASAAAVQPTSLGEAVRWVRDVARGVHDAHLRNVFHRDLKPHNVLVAPHSRRAKIADFGLAVRATTAQPLGPPVAGIAGTPAYMAPEQARGLPGALDPEVPTDRAILVGLDVWGIGAIAYALVAGRPPWASRGDLEPWERAAAGEAPAPLSAMFDGRPIPRRLRRVIAKALAPVPDDRYATALELAADLEAFLARRPPRPRASAIGRATSATAPRPPGGGSRSISRRSRRRSRRRSGGARPRQVPVTSRSPRLGPPPTPRPRTTSRRPRDRPTPAAARSPRPRPARSPARGAHPGGPAGYRGGWLNWSNLCRSGCQVPGICEHAVTCVLVNSYS